MPETEVLPENNFSGIMGMYIMRLSMRQENIIFKILKVSLTKIFINIILKIE